VPSAWKVDGPDSSVTSLGVVAATAARTFAWSGLPARRIALRASGRSTDAAVGA
jgi:hypothetical protein